MKKFHCLVCICLLCLAGKTAYAQQTLFLQPFVGTSILTSSNAEALAFGIGGLEVRTPIAILGQRKKRGVSSGLYVDIGARFTNYQDIEVNPSPSMSSLGNNLGGDIGFVYSRTNNRLKRNFHIGWTIGGNTKGQAGNQHVGRYYSGIHIGAKKVYFDYTFGVSNLNRPSLYEHSIRVRYSIFSPSFGAKGTGCPARNF